MIQRLTYTLLFLLCFTMIQAEVVVLQSGKTIEGEIIVVNEDIVMLKDAEGHKFQFPRSEVTEIRQSEQIIETQQENTSVSGKGNCALRIDMSGGALFVPSLANGGFGALDIQIGTRTIGHQRVFLGAGVGYHAAVADKLNNFLPLMAVFSMPLMEGKHAPEIGAALGYGFAINNPNKGGMMAKLDVSWRYQYKASSALLLGVQARWQQADVKFMEIVDGKEYYSTLGKNFVSVGLRLALEF